MSDHRILSIDDAEAAIRDKFSSEGHESPLSYDRTKVIENDRWFYVPCGWIGSAGCIVNKDDGYVNWLGSALDLETCFWGHDRGLFCDLVDFSFASNTDQRLAERILARFRHMHPHPVSGKPALEPVPYRDSEIAAAISTQFPIFKRHFVWFAIPTIKAASENEGLAFKSILSV